MRPANLLRTSTWAWSLLAWGTAMLLPLGLSGEEEAVVTFLYAPSQIETYTPLTEQRLAENPMFKGEIKGASAEWLLQMATRPQKKSIFDPEAVRLIIRTKGKNSQIVVDRYATARCDGVEYFVDPNIFSYIESGLDRGSLPPPRDYTAAQWQAIHDMHGRVPQMVAISQRNYDRWLTLFVAAIIIVPLLTLLALHLLSGRKSPEIPKEG